MKLHGQIPQDLAKRFVSSRESGLRVSGPTAGKEGCSA
jgi:hypothetical protein